MGACDFTVTAQGDTAQEAFRNAVADAQHEYGHGGYSGTIAEKSEFVIVQLEPEAAHDYDQWPDSVQDKWGPAGAIKLGEKRWLFFGVASS